MKRGWIIAAATVLAWVPAQLALANGPALDLDGSNGNDVSLSQFAQVGDDGSAPVGNMGSGLDGLIGSGNNGLPSTDNSGWGNSNRNETSVGAVPEPMTIGFAAMGLAAALRLRKKNR